MFDREEASSGDSQGCVGEVRARLPASWERVNCSAARLALSTADRGWEGEAGGGGEGEAGGGGEVRMEAGTEVGVGVEGRGGGVGGGARGSKMGRRSRRRLLVDGVIGVAVGVDCGEGGVGLDCSRKDIMEMEKGREKEDMWTFAGGCIDERN